MVAISIPQRVQLAKTAACIAHGVTYAEIEEIRAYGGHELMAPTRARAAMFIILWVELGFMGHAWIAEQIGNATSGPSHIANRAMRFLDEGDEPAMAIYEELVKRLHNPA